MIGAPLGACSTARRHRGAARPAVPDVLPVLVVTTSAPVFNWRMAVRNACAPRGCRLVTARSRALRESGASCDKSASGLDVLARVARRARHVCRDTLRRRRSPCDTGPTRNVHRRPPCVEALAAAVVREVRRRAAALTASLARWLSVETGSLGNGPRLRPTGLIMLSRCRPGPGLAAASDRNARSRPDPSPPRGLYFEARDFLERTTNHQPTNTPAVLRCCSRPSKPAGRIEREAAVEGRWRRHDGCPRV